MVLTFKADRQVLLLVLSVPGGFSNLGMMINTANMEEEAKCGKSDL